MGACPLLLGERAVGTVRWNREGAYLLLDSMCPMEPGFIYRLEVQFPNELKSLGVMMPDSGRFKLRKRILTPDEPISARVLRALPGEEAVWPLPFAFSRLTPTDAAEVVRDPLFLKNCGAKPLAAREGGVCWLALPVELGKETALAPFLTAAVPTEALGKTWAVFLFNDKGELQPPPKR